MKKIWKSVNPIHQFWTLGAWKMIQMRCLMSQEGDKTIIFAWNLLEPCFQFLRIFGKSASFIMEFMRSWESILNRVSMYMYVWMI